MKTKLHQIFPGLLLFVVVVLLWHLSYKIFNNLQQTIPSPYQVFIALKELFLNGILFKYCAASLFRVTVGFYLSFLLAIPTGILLGRCFQINQMFNGIIQFLRPISPLAWIPIAMLCFGIGDEPAIFIIFVSSFFPILISTITAVRKIEPRYFQIASNLKFSIYAQIKYIIFPAISPDIVTATRVSLGVAWIVVVAAEMIAVKSGLGYLIIDSRNALRMDFVIAGMIIIGLIGMVIDQFIVQLEKIRALEWKFGKK